MQPRNENNMTPNYQNDFSQMSQNNFQQQQPHQQNFQSTQYSNFNPFNINQPGSSLQNQTYQPHQTEFYGSQQPLPNGNLMTSHYQPTSHPYSSSPGMQNQNYYGPSPQTLMDQFRSCMNSASPIFILPNVCPNASPAAPEMQPTSIMGQNMGHHMNYPQMGMPYSPPPTFCCPLSCIPYPLPIPIYNQFSHQDRQKEKSQNCECCRKSYGVKETFRNANIFNEMEDHKCKESKDDTICSKKNCPSALNLQALASQFLSNQGIISCVATRLVLRKVPGSNITTNIDETIDRAQKAINQLNKDQLLTESRNAQQVNALINLHMTANPPPNIIPILTMIQLKVNLLKAQVENLINKKLMENQGVGAEVAGNFDPLVLALKTDAELREFLAALRQKECEERVNLNFAPYHAQRVIAQSHLTNIQNKISQVETEMERRQSSLMPRISIINWTQRQFFDPFSNWQNSTFLDSLLYQTPQSFQQKNYESPDPFIIQVRSPKRLNLKPHVGSPETTYESPREVVIQNSTSKITKEIQNKNECPAPSHFSTFSDESKTKKKIRKKPKKSDHSIIVEIDDNSNDNNNDDSGNKSFSGNSSFNMNKTESPFKRISSNETNNDSGYQEKSNFEERSIEINNSVFLNNSTFEKEMDYDNDTEEKSVLKKKDKSQEIARIDSTEIQEDSPEKNLN
ncbi:uncharacterized protein LOC117178257 isoform X2 [Belonocnema kinseyi]|uniref:uncharacterized protein LOC117178257 isoform X2 n=1 Tax=Belonocnema kinseyi TaxID=2817044 RepID=UPI00143D6541|nr:uncharacterized protein LOC117178257 isoform X2 [Belonocnema kinseyi]